MKKILHKLRVWMLGLFDTEPKEQHKKSNFELVLEINSKLLKKIGAYQAAVREICRRSESSYYDWCCDYCVGSTDCKRNGWCENFNPRNDL